MRRQAGDELAAGLGGQELDLVLSGDFWVSHLLTQPSVTDALLEGFASLGDETGGWNAEVVPALGAADLTVETNVVVADSAELVVSKYSPLQAGRSHL